MTITRVIKVDPRSPDPQAVAEAARLIRTGGLVAFPTETVYGLGADALNAEAVRRLFQAKGRPPNDPVIVHLADEGWLTCVASHVPPMAFRLARRFWPGPLTLILPKAASVPDMVTAGLPTVAVRVPSHPVALALIRAADTPVAAPSANLFGHTSPTTAEHVLADLEGKIDLILDGGATWIGVESTVLDLTGDQPQILRPGGVPREALMELLGEVKVARKRIAEGQPAVSPGLLERHYSPRARLILVIGPREAALQYMLLRIEELTKEGSKVGVLVPEEDLSHFEGRASAVQSLGPAHDAAAVARALYSSLRALDGRRVDVIFTRDLGTEGLFLAVHDRLTRAASQTVLLTEE